MRRSAARTRPRTLEGQSIRVADLIAYVNHDTDDAIRAGLLVGVGPAGGRRGACSGASPSVRIGRMVKDVVLTTQAAGLDEIRMSDETLAATLELRAFLFDAVYENDAVHGGVPQGGRHPGRALGEGPRAAAASSSTRRTVERDGRAMRRRAISWPGMTDRFAVALFEQLFIPKPWVDVRRDWQQD